MGFINNCLICNPPPLTTPPSIGQPNQILQTPGVYLESPQGLWDFVCWLAPRGGYKSRFSMCQRRSKNTPNLITPTFFGKSCDFFCTFFLIPFPSRGVISHVCCRLAGRLVRRGGFLSGWAGLKVWVNFHVHLFGHVKDLSYFFASQRLSF